MNETTLKARWGNCANFLDELIQKVNQEDKEGVFNFFRDIIRRNDMILSIEPNEEKENPTPDYPILECNSCATGCKIEISPDWTDPAQVYSGENIVQNSIENNGHEIYAPGRFCPFCRDQQDYAPWTATKKVRELLKYHLFVKEWQHIDTD